MCEKLKKRTDFIMRFLALLKIIFAWLQFQIDYSLYKTYIA